MPDKTLFQKIMDGEIPGEILEEDEKSIVLRDINPRAPIHLLIIPKKPIPRIGEALEEDQDTLGHLLLVAKNMAEKMNLDEGFRVIINNGPHGGETVPHLHVHLLGGRQLAWPPG